MPDQTPNFPSELRQSRLSRRWVLIATGRGKRPHQFEAAPADTAKRDPFEPANVPASDILISVPNDTPDAFHTPSDWKVLAMRNAFPYVAPGKKPRETGAIRDGYGYAELVVHSPDADKNFDSFETAQTEAILSVYQQRYQDLAADPHIRHVQIFTNRGGEAGASVIHPHSQIVALPIIPPHVDRLVHAARRHFAKYGTSVVEDELLGEAQTASRVIEETKHFLVYCPFAPRANYHIRILPKQHLEHFADMPASDRAELAEVLNRTYRRFAALHGDAPYNTFIRSAPTQERALSGFRWHIDLLPHLSIPGGLEASTDVLVLTTAPETAADELRKAI